MEINKVLVFICFLVFQNLNSYVVDGKPVQGTHQPSISPSIESYSEEQGEETNAIDETQDTILDKLNNYNMNTYIQISKGFKTLQDKLEDIAYATPLIGTVTGPVTSALNLISGLINEGHDKLKTNLYHGVRQGLGLKGSVVTTDFNHRPPVKKEIYVKEHKKEETKKKIDALKNMLDE